MANDGPESQPLLQRAGSASPPASPTVISKKPDTSSPSPQSEEGGSESNFYPSRAVEDDVLPETSAIGRTLSWQSAYILVISRVFGSGIFATPGAILRSVGSPGLSLILWVVGACVAACGIAVTLEFGSMLPRSGGHKVYLEFTYRRPRFLASTLVAVQAVVLGFAASNCIVFSQYVLFAFGIEAASEWLRKGLAVALLVAVTLVHGITPRFGVRLQDWLGWIKVGIILCMILSGLFVVIFRRSKLDVEPDSAGLVTGGSLWDNSNWDWGVIATSLFKVSYSYAGLDSVTNVMNEVKEPVRTLRSVTLSALATACGLYMLINVAYFLVVPIEDIKSSGELIAALFFERTFGVQVGRKVLPLAVALSAAGNVMVVTFAQSRLKQEIARQGFLPFSAVLSSTRPFHSPLGALVVHFIPSFLVIVLPPSNDVYSFILEVEGYPAQFISIALAAGLIWLRFKRSDLRRPFRAWIPAVLLQTSLSLALIAAPFFPPEKKPESGLFYASYAIVAISVFALAILYWYIWTVAIPCWRGYRLEEETEVLKDGTSITKLVHVSA
ncbi:uncharacterized protein E0L32_011341 [Thyridium curvatum]|uniref:Methionine permease n=1 Tax=Thyridium curvatum TaxID=1093900 RepID=A0A507BQ29_9PEZI|nr:uncharacterized protein E0L32_011341 [Thyridium curvatum]TPX18948.1 hypothetical protein E0L32_011341 [Thyridium curvatum]